MWFIVLSHTHTRMHARTHAHTHARIYIYLCWIICMNYRHISCISWCNVWHIYMTSMQTCIVNNIAIYTLKRVVFNQVSAFLTQNNLLDRTSLVSEVDTQPRLPCSQLLKPGKNGFQIFNTYLAGSVFCFWPDPPVNPISKGHLRNRTPVVWLLPLR